MAYTNTPAQVWPDAQAVSKGNIRTLIGEMQAQIVAPDPVAATSRGATNPVPATDQNKILLITGAQTFGAAATYSDGFVATYFNLSGSAINVVGLDATYSIPSPGLATVTKVGTALVASGSNTTNPVLVLDAA